MDLPRCPVTSRVQYIDHTAAEAQRERIALESPASRFVVYQCTHCSQGWEVRMQKASDVDKCVSCGKAVFRDFAEAQGEVQRLIRYKRLSGKVRPYKGCGDQWHIGHYETSPAKIDGTIGQRSENSVAMDIRVPTTMLLLHASKWTCDRLNRCDMKGTWLLAFRFTERGTGFIQSHFPHSRSTTVPLALLQVGRSSS